MERLYIQAYLTYRQEKVLYYVFFGEILRQADKINQLTAVKGVVLIDEIDKHLHIKLQKEVYLFYLNSSQIFNLLSVLILHF